MGKLEACVKHHFHRRHCQQLGSCCVLLEKHASAAPDIHLKWEKGTGECGEKDSGVKSECILRKSWAVKVPFLQSVAAKAKFAIYVPEE